MSTRLRMRDARFNVYKNARDISLARGSGSTPAPTTSVIGGETELAINMAAGEVAEFVSAPMMSDVTISGTITTAIFLQESVNTIKATVRLKFWKVTSGGSDIETYIGQLDGSTECSTTSSAAPTLSGTLPSTLIGTDEKILVRIYAIPIGAASLSVGTLTLRYNAGYGFPDDSWIEFTEDLPVTYEGAGLFLRNTQITGVSGFYDLWHTPGASPVDAVVNTVNSGTDIQWTLTGGGTALAWISRRIKQKITFTTSTTAGITETVPFCQGEAKESGNAVNCGITLRCWKRDLSGVETLLWGPYGPTAELTTTLAKFDFRQKSPAGIPNLSATLDVNDRIVVRMYCVNKGTMGAGTATFRYNQVIDAVGGAAATFIIGAVGALFKNESEPDFPMGTNRMMTGMGS